MFIRNKQPRLTMSKDVIDRIVKEIETADKVLIGAGAGLSAAAGLDYGSKEVFDKEYAVFKKAGYETIIDGISKLWTLTPGNVRRYWGFWSHHINYVYYSQQGLELYEELFNVIKDKDYFVITTNGDDLFYKTSFDKKRIFSMQGSYSKFQCQDACHDKLYDSEPYVTRMLEGFDEDSLMILEEDIPRCPICGKYLKPNLRIDQNFVENKHVNQEGYMDFIDDNDENIVFIELGVGFNTPVIIRYPFESMTYDNPNAVLIRVNNQLFSVPDEIMNQTIIANIDIKELLTSIDAIKAKEGLT